MPEFNIDTQDLINGAILGFLHISGFLVVGLLGLGFAFGIVTYIELTSELNRLSETVDAVEAETDH